VPGCSAPASPGAMLAPTWRAGSVQYSTIINCASVIFGSPYNENGVGTYMNQLMDLPANLPRPDDGYYLSVVVAGLGQPCSGTRVNFEFELPPNTAINPGQPAYCLYSNSPAAQCPPLQMLGNGRIWAPSGDSPNANTWPLPQGVFLEVQIPVVSTAPLTNQPARAHVKVLDGNASPELTPEIGVFVFSATGTAPTFDFATPSTTQVTTNTAHGEGFLYSTALSGNIFIDWGTTPGALPSALALGNVAAGNYKVSIDWDPSDNFQPNTTYYWRIRFVGSNSTTYLSPVQSFTTKSFGVVGNGTAASCSDAALRSELQLSGSRNITFDCGAAPATILLSSGFIAVGSGVKTLDGGNKVTLVAAVGQRLLTASAGAALSLKDVTLTGGNSNSCGGAILFAGASLTLEGVRLIGNNAADGGGALCINNASATVNITSSLFLSNTASSIPAGSYDGVGGGAIALVSGKVNVDQSEFSGNTAVNGSGGAVESKSNNTAFSATRSLFQGNVASQSGGAC
jgi:hypothetical protein